MKTERFNSIIFIVSLIVFLLQIVGYLAPAWFVREVAIQYDSKGLRADGRRFHLPFFRENADESLTGFVKKKNMDDNEKFDVRESSEKKPKSETDSPPSILLEPVSPSNDRPKPDSPTKGRPEPVAPPNDRSELVSPPNGHQKPVSLQNGRREPATTPNGRQKPGSLPNTLPEPGSPINGIPKLSKPPKRNPVPSKPPSDVHQNEQLETTRSPNAKEQFEDTRGSERERRALSLPTPGTKPETSFSCKEGDICSKNKTDAGKTFPEQLRPLLLTISENSSTETPRDFDGKQVTDLKGDETNEKDITKNKSNMPHHEDKAQLLYLTAGFWYSRACVITRDPEASDDATMQWCTMYTRLDDKTLEEKRNMFELRLEATLAVVLSALSLLISSTACCSRKHQGRRAVSSLTTLFISGAVMAIPVVHIITNHVQIHNQIIRTRKWKNLTKVTYIEHDLFDHFSVILCGVASVISVLFAFILTLVSCRSTSKSDNLYNFKHSLEEKENKYDLPINWVHNSKITLPHAEIKHETRDDSESGYSEVKDECTMPGIGGGLTGNDEDRIELDSSEIKTFDM